MHRKWNAKSKKLRNLSKLMCKMRLSLIQWETLMHQISNGINNLPIGLKNRTLELENLNLITPNRLILGRNNDHQMLRPQENN